MFGFMDPRFGLFGDVAVGSGQFFFYDQFAVRGIAGFVVIGLQVGIGGDAFGGLIGTYISFADIVFIIIHLR